MKPLLTTALTLFAALLILACSRDSTPVLDISPTPLLPSDSDGPLIRARVINVIDGATIEVEIDGQLHRVHYLGIRVPEGGPQDGGGRTLGQEALEFNRFLVEGRTVELEKDATESDLLGNLLRYVYVGGEMANMTLVTNGYAIVADFPPRFRYQTQFLVAEENAKTSLRGIWNPAPRAAEVQAGTTPVPFSGGTLPVPRSRGAQKCDYSSTAQPVIKGNVDSRTAARIYYVPDNLFYSTTVIDEAQGDRWFCTEEEAIAAGWQKAKR